MKKIIRINCKTEIISIKDESEEFKKLGGRGLTSHIISEEVPPQADALGGENKLIIAGMLIAGTSISTANRLSVGTKSPLTGGIKEANVGGTAGFYLAKQGIKAIILEDIPKIIKSNVLLIKANGEVVLQEAHFLKEKGNYDITRLCREKFGESISIISCGIAGEKRYLNSSIQVSEMGIGYPCRAAARGGVGAVLGSKGIKAIVICKSEKPYEIFYADKETFMKASKKVTQAILQGRGMLSEVGTVGFIGATVPMAIMPYKNFSGGALSEEEQKKFQLPDIVERFKSYGGSTGHACQPGCVVKCSNIVNDKKGDFLTAGFEYEIIALAGPNCLIYDIELIAKLDRLCDDYGFDSIEFASSLGVYMEAGKIKWGDEESVNNLIEEMYLGGEVSADFGMGTERLGKKYNVAHIPTVKGQAMAAYEPRNLKGTGTTYAISTMGADHTCGASLSRRDLVPTEKESQLEFAVNSQAVIAACDCNVCLFAWGAVAAAGQDYADAVSGVLGGEWTFSSFIAMGNITVDKERKFNYEAGITEKDDKLPDFFYKEPSSATGAVFDITEEEILEKWHK